MNKPQNFKLAKSILLLFAMLIFQMNLVICQSYASWSVEKVDTEPLDSTVLWQLKDMKHDKQGVAIPIFNFYSLISLIN